MTNQKLDSQLLEAASEYALGVMQGEERLEFEQEMARNFELQEEVAAWEERLSPMLNMVEPVTPPPGIWDQVEQRISGEATAEATGDAKSNLWDSLAFWRNLGMSAAGLVLVMGLTLFGVNQEPGMDQVLMVTGKQAQVQWVLGTSEQSEMLQIQAVAAPEMPVGEVCQLWMENPDGTLRPVGVLPHNGKMQMKFPSTLMPGSRFKVSIEKADNLPSDKPSKKFVFEGGLIKI